MAARRRGGEEELICARLAARTVLSRFEGREAGISAWPEHDKRPGGAPSSALGRFEGRQQEGICVRLAARVALGRFKGREEEGIGTPLPARFPMPPAAAVCVGRGGGGVGCSGSCGLWLWQRRMGSAAG
nr:unnamed protein product [Digitaria exilis]